jgi:hypothetical protein
LDINFTTWAEEGGFYTGQRELRNYVLQIMGQI